MILVGGGLGYFALHSISTRTIETKQETKSIEMGKVVLSVHNLSMMASFYEKTLGLDLVSQGSGFITFGKEGRAIIQLQEEKSYSAPAKTDA